MTLKDKIYQVVGQLVFEKIGKRRTLAEWKADLEVHGRAIDYRAAKTKKTEQAQKTLRHISGIERWGQSRLWVFLGESFQRDEYNGYRPERNLTLEEQRAFFRETRQETLNIAQQLIAAEITTDQLVDHNEFGPFTANGWLRYLDGHANIESRRF